MSDLQTSDPAAVVEAFRLEPLSAAPPALRTAVGRLWMLNAHLFPNPLPIAAAVGLWVRDHGLREEDAAHILALMLQPEEMARFRYASDLMVRLAHLAATAIDHRRKKDAAAGRRGVPADVLSGPEVRDVIRGFTGEFGGGQGGT